MKMLRNKVWFLVLFGLLVSGFVVLKYYKYQSRFEFYSNRIFYYEIISCIKESENEVSPNLSIDSVLLVGCDNFKDLIRDNKLTFNTKIEGDSLVIYEFGFNKKDDGGLSVVKKDVGFLHSLLGIKGDIIVGKINLGVNKKENEINFPQIIE
jgi:hypothetical protein